MENLAKITTVIVLLVLMIFGFSFLMSFPVKWAWNYTMPYLFGFKTIGWLHALCLSFLCSIFFKTNVTNKSE